ncbi:MAG: hypothetical protein RMJ43_00645 [Chloroherpetonaceae bacterium]|nr:hypothetical protein [Chthonomonadaceae bacterium]MDW8206317.1 hypothetical protein [Chloroherpetonaceae bacterium]
MRYLQARLAVALCTLSALLTGGCSENKETPAENSPSATTPASTGAPASPMPGTRADEKGEQR